MKVTVPGEESTDWCAYCGVSEADTLDHILPVASSGIPPSDNLVPACHDCNVRLGDLEFDSFEEKRTWMYSRKRALGLPVERPNRVVVTWPED